jgi:hypothetical protein
VVSLTRQIVRVGAIGASARRLAQSFIEWTGIRRESVSERACGSGFVVQCVRVGWLSGFGSSGTHEACRAWRAAARWRRAGLGFHFAPSALRRSRCFWTALSSWRAEDAIRGRWRRAQGEGCVARRRCPGCKSAASGRPSARRTGAAQQWLARWPSCRMIRIAAWAHGCSASF